MKRTWRPLCLTLALFASSEGVAQTVGIAVDDTMKVRDQDVAYRVDVERLESYVKEAIKSFRKGVGRGGRMDPKAESFAALMLQIAQTRSIRVQ